MTNNIAPSQAAVFGIQRWLITFTVMLVAIIEVLDMTIVNVSLPQMMGNLGTNTSEITWVLTSYIVSSAIVMPLTGFLVARLTTRRLLMTNIVGFLIASMCCGLSQNLTAIVFFRALQGIFGAALVPISQYVLRDTFTAQEQGQAMAIWGIGIMVAPIMGPTLGGYITEHSSWRWIFYLNIPICIAAFFMAYFVIPKTEPRPYKTDWIGLLLMALGIGCLQFFLDQGNEKGWFDESAIVILCLIFIFCLTVFTVRGLVIGKKNIINLYLFRDRNFAACTLVMLLFGLALFGIVALVPIQLQHLYHYPVVLTGLLSAPQGIASAITMMIVGPLITKVDPRKIIFIGIVCAALASYRYSQFTLDTDLKTSIIFPSIMLGVGMGMFFVPISALALSTLAHEDIAEASGLFSFSRSLGSSIGISILSTVLSHETAVNWANISSNINRVKPNLAYWLAHSHLTLSNPTTKIIISNQVAANASMNAFNDAYWLVSLLFAIMLPVVFIIDKPGKIKLGMYSE